MLANAAHQLPTIDRTYGCNQSIDSARSVLARYFGYNSFRPVQERAVRAVLSGKDALIVLPTGGGKSVCYQVPALMRQGLTVVISPLISLMKDQVGALTRRGISAACLNSTVSAADSAQCSARIRDGSLRLLYLAPERLENSRTLNLLEKAQLALLAIDEAHCISEWGHNFRPVYRRIGHIRQALSIPQTVALTATATPSVRNDISHQLALKNHISIIGGFDRTNLTYHVRLARTEKDKDSASLALLRNSDSPAIVYSPTRKSVERITAMLNKLRIRAIAYHAGLDDSLRQRSQDAFMEQRARVIVATSAFGMGIDKPDVRLVIHHGIPGSLEAYYQEAGRAGRDGRPSTCVLLYSPKDRFTHEYFIANTSPTRATVQKILTLLRQISNSRNSQTISTANICSALKGQVNHHEVIAALNLLTTLGVCSAQPPSDQLWIRIIASSKRYQHELATNPTALALMSWLANYNSSAQSPHNNTFNLSQLTRDFPTPTGILNLLTHLASQQLIVFTRSSEGVKLLPQYLKTLPASFSWKSLDRRRSSELARLGYMQRYTTTRQCRRAFVLRYFGEQLPSTLCGACDRCLGSPETLPIVV